MILYLDTSALVKLYAEVSGAPLVREAVGAAQLCVCHLIGYAETRAALAKKRRTGEFSVRQWESCKRELERTWSRFERMGIDDALVRRAGSFVDRFCAVLTAFTWRRRKQCFVLRGRLWSFGLLLLTIAWSKRQRRLG